MPHSYLITYIPAGETEERLMRQYGINVEDAVHPIEFSGATIISVILSK